MSDRSMRTPSGQERAAAPVAAPNRPAEGATPAAALLGLQHRAGNTAVQRLIVQRHLGATAPEDVGETAEVNPAGKAPGTTGTGTGTTSAGTGTGAGSGTTPAPAEEPSRAKQVTAKLGLTDTGRWALGVVTKWKVPVDYEYAGTGSFHRGGSIFINKNLSVDAATIVMMHEAQHAYTFKSGNAAAVTGLTREVYVAAKIADEAEAVVRQIEGAVPMVAHHGATLAGSGINQGLIDRYRRAFYAKRDALEAADPKMTRAEINATCRTHVRDTEVTNWFHDGTFITSTGGSANVSYSDHYGAIWDANNTAPAPTPTPLGPIEGASA